jgi:hypothetical protein
MEWYHVTNVQTTKVVTLKLNYNSQFFIKNINQLINLCWITLSNAFKDIQTTLWNRYYFISWFLVSISFFFPTEFSPWYYLECITTWPFHRTDSSNKLKLFEIVCCRFTRLQRYFHLFCLFFCVLFGLSSSGPLSCSSNWMPRCLIKCWLSSDIGTTMKRTTTTDNSECRRILVKCLTFSYTVYINTWNLLFFILV